MGKIVRIDTLHKNDRKSCSANGDGIRIVVWFSGCEIKCEGCHNEEYQNPEIGEEFSEKHLLEISDELNGYGYYKGISVLGGEPFSRFNIQSSIELCKFIKEQFPSKDIWIWSGYTREVLERHEDTKELLSYCDYLVDGPFILSQRNVGLKFRGSENQRIHKLKD